MRPQYDVRGRQGSQSEALGPFLWGRKANVSGFALEECEGRVIMSAEHDGYSPVRVRRTVEVRGANVVITDEVDDKQDAMTSWHLPFAGVKAGDGPTDFHLQSGASVHIEASASLKSASSTIRPPMAFLPKEPRSVRPSKAGL